MQLIAQEEVLSGSSSALYPAGTGSGDSPKTPEELAVIVSRVAASEGWLERVRLRSEDRWYERLYHDSDYDIWAISWMPGQSTGFHDHGDSVGAFVVATGVLEEHRPGKEAVLIHPGGPRVFGNDYAHDVRNVSIAPAVSIHAYSPPLSEMNKYELEGGQLVAREDPSEHAEDGRGWSVDRAPVADRTAGSSIEQVLSAVRARLRRLSPKEARAAVVNAGAVLVDIRPEAQRAIEGSIPGALIVERNVLEWRFDPASAARLPIASDHQLEIIVFCSEGYTSSLAAGSLQDLGLWRATDVVGGFQAWRAAGLPTIPPSGGSGAVASKGDSSSSRTDWHGTTERILRQVCGPEDL